MREFGNLLNMAIIQSKCVSPCNVNTEKRVCHVKCIMQKKSEWKSLWTWRSPIDEIIYSENLPWELNNRCWLYLGKEWIMMITAKCIKQKLQIIHIHYMDAEEREVYDSKPFGTRSRWLKKIALNIWYGPSTSTRRWTESNFFLFMNTW